MNEKLLYFPYINIPHNQWTVKSLLYWDSVGIIVPLGYAQEPYQYEVYTRELLQTDLIEQVFPVEYIARVDGFDDGFLKLIGHHRFDVEKKRREFEKGHCMEIHVQKFGDRLLDRLIELGIARRKDWQWYYVESKTAGLIMLYLATFIGKVGNFTPATDSVLKLKTGTRQRWAYQFHTTRQQLTDDLIPYPIEPDLTQLRRFREKYHAELRSFRIQIERNALNISRIRSVAERDKEYELTIAEINDKREKILRELKQARFRLSFGSLLGIVAGAFDFRGNPFSVAGAVASVFQNNSQAALDKDYSYLALIDKEWEPEFHPYSPILKS